MGSKSRQLRHHAEKLRSARRRRAIQFLAGILVPAAIAGLVALPALHRVPAGTTPAAPGPGDLEAWLAAADPAAADGVPPRILFGAVDDAGWGRVARFATARGLSRDSFTTAGRAVLDALRNAARARADRTALDEARLAFPDVAGAPEFPLPPIASVPSPRPLFPPATLAFYLDNREVIDALLIRL